MFYIFEAMSFKSTIAYFKHQLTANNRHGTHSPFVYRLADEVIYDFSAKKVYETIETQRKKLLHDDESVKLLAKKKLSQPRLGQLIFRLALNSSPQTLLVLNANFGINAAYLAKACPQAKIIAVEPCSATAAIASKTFEELDVTNVELHVGSFKEVVSKIDNIDFVYIDGKQTQETVLAYFNCCLPQLHEQSAFICYGINQNEEMKQAWVELKNHPQVRVTINLFWLGLVYFKKDQAKEHFKLKF